jgi:hypothetical protein
VTIGARTSTFAGTVVGSGIATALARPNAALSSIQRCGICVRAILQLPHWGEVEEERGWTRRIACAHIQQQRQTEKERYGKGDPGKREIQRAGYCATCLTIIPANRFRSNCWLFWGGTWQCHPCPMMSPSPSNFTLPKGVRGNRKPHIWANTSWNTSRGSAAHKHHPCTRDLGWLELLLLDVMPEAHLPLLRKSGAYALIPGFINIVEHAPTVILIATTTFKIQYELLIVVLSGSG